MIQLAQIQHLQAVLDQRQSEARAWRRRAVLENLKRGWSRRKSALEAGVSTTMFYNWLRGDPGFMEAVLEAEAQGNGGF